ncbi:MAG: aminoacyl-tRNA hydrolase [Pseudomonadota bacterium]
MLLLVGLGNPGDDYARHRHNVGFMAVDAIAERHGFAPERSKFQGVVRDGFLSGPGGREKTVILKPLTYMNESGRAVGEAMRFFKLDPSAVVVFYDELDLAPGKIKVKTGGGAAGHNGIKSIDAHIGNDFRRVRIGIGHPGDRAKVTGHVLGNFSVRDRDWLDALLGAIADAAPFLSDENNRFATDVARRLAPKKPAARKKTEKDADAPSANSSPADNKDTDDKSGNPFTDALGKVFGRQQQKDN